MIDIWVRSGGASWCLYWKTGIFNCKGWYPTSISNINITWLTEGQQINSMSIKNLSYNFTLNQDQGGINNLVISIKGTITGRDGLLIIKPILQRIK